MADSPVVNASPVARDIAGVLGARSRGEGYLHGGEYVVTWAIGHLVTLAQPHEVNQAWKTWRRESLPMLPQQWPLVVLEETRSQFAIVRKLINDKQVQHIVCATDAGREGELIFRLIYEAAGCIKPVRRLWISSLTPDAIRAGLASLKDSHFYDPLAAAARGRAQADWLVGMNLSRLYTLAPIEILVYLKLKSPRPDDHRDVSQLILAGINVRHVREFLLKHAPQKLVTRFETLVSQA